MGTYTCERCEMQSPDRGDFTFSDDGTVSFCLNCSEAALDNNDITADAILHSIIDLGPEGHKMLIEVMLRSWTDSTKELLDNATPPTDGDTEAVVIDMLQVSMSMAVSSALSTALFALQKYTLTDGVLDKLGEGVCSHPECVLLREARANPENN